MIDEKQEIYYINYYYLRWCNSVFMCTCICLAIEVIIMSIYYI